MMPEANVAAIITRTGHSDKVLLTRRNIEPFKGHWCLPGGHIDRCERARAAVLREVKEETGLDFAARFFGYFDEILPERNIHAVVLVFEGVGTGTPSLQPGEVTDLAWFPIEEASSLSLAFTHNEIVEAYHGQIEKGGEPNGREG
jgi:8-oxo-dGTP diphosphatase